MSTRKKYQREARAKAKGITRRLLFRISSYVGYLEQCLKQQESLPVLSRHVYVEREIRTTPYSQRIVGKIPIPPHVQALIVEEIGILEEANLLYRKKDDHKEELRSLITRRNTVLSFLAEWVHQQVEPPEVMMLLPYRNIRTVIGDNWQLLFVETLQLKLPFKGSNS